MTVSFSLKTLLMAGMLGAAGFAMSHGDVTPQPVDTGNLPELGEEPLTQNPFREGNEHGDINAQAVEIGESAYAGNCAACHGIQAMSGGLTPDLRELT
ncbi:MAG: cytochrome c-550 PedF, partial [Oleiphilaceae bacterium]|nr:cytochrome c-550 PedF [Oleiphilaceae bacterium]